MDGMQVVRELQDGSPCAVLILTGRNDVTDRVLGLELGADDYIVKPFEPARAGRPRALHPAPLPARRQRRQRRRTQHGALRRLDLRRQPPRPRRPRRPRGPAFRRRGRPLATLLRRPNKILSREQLLGERDVDPFDRSIDVRISRLRRKLDDDRRTPA